MGMDFVDFQVESEITMSDVPSENDIWMEARSPAGDSPPLVTLGRLEARTAKRFMVGLRATMKAFADFHACVVLGEAPINAPLRNS